MKQLQMNALTIGTWLIFRTEKLLEEAPIFPHQMYKFRFPRPITNLHVNEDSTF